MANQFIRAYELTFGVPHKITQNSFVGPIRAYEEGSSRQNVEEFLTLPRQEAEFPLAPTSNLRVTGDPIKRNPIRAEERAEAMDSFFASNNYSFVQFTDHQVTFKIDKSKDGGGEDGTNSLKITVFNATDDTISYLEQVSGKKPYIRLKAGYVDNMKTIFKGNVESVEDEDKGHTRKTVIKVSDGGPAVKEALSFRKYPKGTNVDDILSDLMNDLGLPRGSVTELGSPLVTNKPLYFTGNTARAITKLGKSLGLHFSVQDLTINLMAPAKPIYYVSALVTPETGLVGSVSFLDENESKTTSENSEEETEDNDNKDELELSSGIGTYGEKLVLRIKSALDLPDGDRKLNRLRAASTTLTNEGFIRVIRAEFSPTQINKLITKRVLNYPQPQLEKEEKKEPRRGISFRTLLNGAIQPNHVVVVEVPDKEGNRKKSFYRAMKVKHTGDYEGNDWFTDVDAEWVDPDTIDEAKVKK